MRDPIRPRRVARARVERAAEDDVDGRLLGGLIEGHVERVVLVARHEAEGGVFLRQAVGLRERARRVRDEPRGEDTGSDGLEDHACTSRAGAWRSKARSRGCAGSALLERACVQLKAAGYRELFLCVTAGNESARKLYLRHGFSDVQEFQAFYWNRFPPS